MANEGMPQAGDHAAICAALDEVVAPLLALDGASVELVQLHEGVLTLRAKGSLRGCPGIGWTAKGVILPVVRAVDERVHEVRIT